MSIIKKNLTFIILFLLIFITDRISKFWVITKVKNTLDSTIVKTSYINIELIWNEGVAFGLLSTTSPKIYNIISIIVLIVIMAVIYLIKKSKNIEKFFLIMVLAGACGNFYDRIVYKSVPDFIDFHIKDFHWFIFNVADIFITLGILLIITREIISNKKKND